MSAERRAGAVGERAHRAWAGAVLVAATLAGSGGAEAGTPRVSYADGSLTIEAVGVSGRELLGEIGRQAGFVVRAVGANLEPSVTLFLHEVPLDRGIRAVLKQLGGRNHAFVWDSATNAPLALVVLANDAVPAPSAPAIVPAIASEPAAVAPPPAQLPALAVANGKRKPRPEGAPPVGAGTARQLLRDRMQAMRTEEGRQDMLQRFQELRKNLPSE